MSSKEEQRPLFTIAVLVSGVVGGLAVVMTVVYLYRFCLKKRPPVTTTGKPDHKREQIRSIATSQCRPLPLPLAADANPYQTTHNTTPPRISESLVEKEAQFGSPTRIAQVFPLIPKEIPYVQRSVGDVSQKSYLSVGEAPARAQSAEHLKVTDPEIRRASFDVPRGTGRQLPSTEGLEQKYADRARRMSTFARSNAIQGQFPVKQNSSPLPEHKRIYERGHAHSRSWNPEGAQLTPPPIKEPVHYQYYQMNEVYPEHSFIPKINEPEVHSLAVRPFQRQAKSFDERDRGRGDVGERRKSMDRRTASDAERSFTRQATLNILQPDTPVAAACQTLWAAKGHLEQLHALGISDPSSASTSFESNTDSHTAGGGIDDKERDGDAERKRLKYRSLLIQRKFLSTAAVSSMDSTNSTESSAPDAMFASSMDSTKSELEQRRLSLMTRHAAISTPHISNIRQHASMDHGSTRPVASIEPFLAPQGVNSRRLMERDFSVDSKSDNLFREWSRVDPAYAEKDRRPVVQQKPQALLQRGATEDHVQYPQRERRYSRQMTIGGGGVIVPLICYPDEQNCSR